MAPLLEVNLSEWLKQCEAPGTCLKTALSVNSKYNKMPPTLEDKSKPLLVKTLITNIRSIQKI